jgi:protein O-GlcNAc transferase
MEQWGATPASWTELGTALYACGRVAEGAQAYAEALSLDPRFGPAASNRLFGLHMNEDCSPEQIASEHLAWGRQASSDIQCGFDFHNWNLSAERPLRVGVLASDLRSHSIVYFIGPVLEHLDPVRFPVTVFSNVKGPDETTERLKAGSQRWIAIERLSSRESAEAIYEEKIDILIEIGGHTSPKTLEVAAWKPAPLQISYLAYPDTTGLPSVDYLLTSSIADPPGTSESLYCEQLLRLDPCGLCYRPPPSSPRLRRRKAGEAVVFGSFAQRQKLSPTTLGLWAEILRRVPGARLLSKAKAWIDPQLRDEMRDWFARQGIEPSRLELAAHIRSTRDHLDLYNAVDICLDTFPYSGITTTCEALWMGVPVIALPGGNQVSRLCSAILHAAGYPELVAGSEAEYIEKAVALASNVAQIRRGRSSMRSRLKRSPVMDERRFTATCEKALREVWQRWVRPQGSIVVEPGPAPAE